MSATARMVEIIDQFAAHVGITPATSDPLNGIEARWEMLRDGGVKRPGLAFAAWMDLGLVGGVVPPLLANCRDVGALLGTLARYHPLWGDDEVVVDINRSGWAAVTLRAPVGAVVHRDTLDAFLAVLARTFGQLTNPPMRPARLSLRSRDVDGYEAIATTLRPGADVDQLEFSPADLATPIALADPVIAAVLAGYAETEVAQRDANWERRVRAEIRGAVGRPPNLADVASRLAHSPRTLQQRLLEQGTSYAVLLDDERRMHSLGLLSNHSLAVTTAAHRAGYQSIEGFSRAVRRWTGMSPSEWRTTSTK